MKSKLSLSLCVCITFIAAACSSSVKPSAVARDFINALNEGKADKMLTFLSTNFIRQSGGISEVKARLPDQLIDSHKKCQVLTINIDREDIAGDLAEVDAKTTIRCAGKPRPMTPESTPEPEEGPLTFKLKFVKENQAWKIDHIEAVAR